MSVAKAAKAIYDSEFRAEMTRFPATILGSSQSRQYSKTFVGGVEGEPIPDRMVCSTLASIGSEPTELSIQGSPWANH